MSKEEIVRLEWRESDPKVVNCACCGRPPALFEIERRGATTKMVNCDTAELLPDEGAFSCDCPMYTPGFSFNKATRREAVLYWNAVQNRLIALRAEAIDASVDAVPAVGAA